MNYLDNSLVFELLTVSDGAWSSGVSGSWGVSGNWFNSAIADGNNKTAYFTNVLSGAVAVSLDKTRQIGNVVFGDSVTVDNVNWTIDNGGDSVRVLQLAGTNPTITVNDLGTGSATISAEITGTTLTKDGSGKLILTGNNTYTGGTTIEDGWLQMGNANALSTGSITVNGGTLDLNAYSIIRSLSGAGGFITDDSAGVGTTTLEVNQSATTTFGGVIQNGTAKSLALTKSGTGQLTLTGDNLYTGTTTINGGTLALSGGDNRLAISGSVNFTGNSRLSIANNQTLSSVTVANGTTGTITGGGGLVLTGSSFSIGGTDNNTSQTLDLTGLSTFHYNNNAGTFKVGGTISTGGDATTVSGAVVLPGIATITASSFGVGNTSHSQGAGPNVGTLTLNATTTINANTIQLGNNQAKGTIKYASVSNPTLTLRGSNGSGPVTTMDIGAGGGFNNATYASLVDLTTGVTGTSTLNAQITTLSIGYFTRTTSGGGGTYAGELLMGSGLLDATTIYLGRNSAGSATGGSATGTLTVSGGTVKVNNLDLGERPQAIGTVTGVFNLNNDAHLYAQTISPGAGTATRTFNWNDGTIHNYNSSTDLTINDYTGTFALIGVGAHIFNIDSGRQGTVNVVMSGSGNLTKGGSGTLTVAAANTYSGTTTISAGNLKVANSSALQNSTVIYNNGGGTLNFGVLTDATLGGLSGNKNLALVNNSSQAVTLSVGNNNTTTTYSGGMTGSGTLTTIGNGQLILTGNSSIGGATVQAGTLTVQNSTGTGIAGAVQVTGGTLQVANSSGNGLSGSVQVSGGDLRVNNTSGFGVSGAVTVSSGTLGGSGTINGAVTISGGYLAPGNSIESLASTTLTLNSGTLNWEFLTDSSGTYQDSLDQYLVSGALTVNGTMNVNLLQYRGEGDPNNGLTFDDPNQLAPPEVPVNSQSYKLIKYGSLAGSGTFSVANPSSQRQYMFRTITDAGNWLVLDISQESGYWSGNGSSDSWADAGNWGGTVPASPGAWIYFQGFTRPTPSNDVARAYDRVIFRQTTIPYTINGATLTLATLIQNNTTATHTFLTPLVMNAGTGQFQVNTASGNLVINGDITGTGTLTKLGSQVLELTGNNTYSGATEIQAGTLRVANPTSALSPNSNVRFNGGVLESSGTFTRSLGSGGGSLQWIGSGGFSARGGTLTVNLGGNGIPGAVTWNSGSFTPSGSTLKFSSSTADSTVRFLNPIDLAGGTRIFEVANGTAAIDAELAGTLSNGGVTKTGAGTMLLSANNDYTGATTINAGALIVNGTLASSAVFVSGGTTLGGTGTLNGSTTVASTGHLSPAIGAVGTLTFNTLTLQTGFVYDWQLGDDGVPESPGTGDLVNVGTLNFSGSAWTLSMGIESNLMLTRPDLFGPQLTYNEYRLFGFAGTTANTNSANALKDSMITVLGNGRWITENAQILVHDNAVWITNVWLIPEPNVVFLWLAGAFTLWSARRRQRT